MRQTCEGFGLQVHITQKQPPGRVHGRKGRMAGTFSVDNHCVNMSIFGVESAFNILTKLEFQRVKMYIPHLAANFVLLFFLYC